MKKNPQKCMMEKKYIKIIAKCNGREGGRGLAKKGNKKSKKEKNTLFKFAFTLVKFGGENLQCQKHYTNPTRFRLTHRL